MNSQEEPNTPKVTTAHARVTFTVSPTSSASITEVRARVRDSPGPTLTLTLDRLGLSGLPWEL